MSAETHNAMISAMYTKTSTLRMIWLIAWRQMVEAVRTRSTLVMTGFFLVFQTAIVWFSVGPMLQGHLSPREMSVVAGKVLGAVLPALGYAIIGILAYFTEITLLYGPGTLGLLPVGLSVLILLVIPAITIMASAVAVVISSRVGTFQSAQNYSSLILVVLWFVLFGLVFLVGLLGLWLFAVVVAVIFGLDVLLIVLGAKTWRREEVMARQ
ncbi:MAG: hypothetical protein E6I91_18660 [Chloroflexi bacterium]|nr:MAG: hypothetical protein E6I91_18660 [Chloroflexota bacterium]